MKKGLCGGTKNAPIPDKKALDAGRPWVPGPTGNKICRQNPKKGASIAPAQDWAFPWESLLRGVGKTTRRVSETTPGLLDKVWPQNDKGKRKTKQKKHKKTLAASRPQEKGLGRGERTSSSPISSRRIPKPRGAQNGTPRKTPRSGTHGQNGRNRQKRRETKRKKNKQKQVRAKGCPVTT